MEFQNGTASLEAALLLCAQQPDVRVLRRVGPIDRLVSERATRGRVRRIGIVDTEATSTNARSAELLDIAVAVLLVDAAGELIGVEKTLQSLRDPGGPIPAEVTKLTGITNEMVTGRILSQEKWARLLSGCDLLVAHNAAYDVPIVERFLPEIADQAWACSLRQIGWLDHGFDGAKLGHLLMQIGRFATGHRAAADVISLCHILAHRDANGRTLMSELLEKAACDTVRIDAKGTDFAIKDRLRERRYRWDPVGKAWWIEVCEDEVDEERRWLEFEIGCRNPVMTVMTARTRFR
ncbi:3'-5' exonuclease [Sphingopyxis sp.]|uniref:3'-5' exonuclease n=1 Tax=Sphingopyxis sp. TaxID=1908224 RepID=UPI0025902037|nr:3'-5' exonuclease [Sphingopyxis sp.]